MRLNEGKSLMRLTASCEIRVGNIGRADGCVVVEITQAKAAGEETTTLLLCPDGARELASVLLSHCGSPGGSSKGSARQRLTVGQEARIC